MVAVQHEWSFFDKKNPPSVEQRRWWVDSKNTECALNKFIGNYDAIKRLRRIAYTALGNYNHCCSEMSLAFIGPASTGKTTLARLFAETLELTFIEINPRQIKNLYDIFAVMYHAFHKDGLPLMANNNVYKIPPSIVFIDEVHSLKQSVVDGLLKPTEAKDRMMAVVDRQDNQIAVDCKSVCWIIATTDRGKLFDAFDTRFSKIFLKMYNKEEIAEIIHFHNSNIPREVCDLIASYSGKVPREALDFATEIELEQTMSGDGWDIVCKRIAEERGIDPFGMTYQRLNILKALSKKAVSLKRLPNIANCKIEELEKFILPPLLESSDGDALISVGARGFEITKAGLNELQKRDISTGRMAC